MMDRALPEKLTRLAVLAAAATALGLVGVAWFGRYAPRPDPLPVEEPADRGVPVRVHVRDENDQPLHEAAVWARGSLLGWTGADGRFEERVPREVFGDERWVLRVAADGYEEAEVLALGNTFDPVETMVPAGHLRGVVVAADGSPVPGARVVYRYADEPPPANDRELRSGQTVHDCRRFHHPEATTLQDGTFVLRGCRPGEAFLIASAPGFLPGASELVAVTTDGTGSASIELSIDEACEVERLVHVRRPDGTVHDQVLLVLLDPDRRRPELIHGSSPVRLRLARGKEYRIEVHDRDQNYAAVRLAAVSADHRPLELELGEPDPLEVDVVDVDGNRLADAEVGLSLHHGSSWFGSQHAETSASGPARLRLPETPFLLSAKADGYRREYIQEIDPATLTQPLVVTLERSGGVQGRVMHAGGPVANATVVLSEGQGHITPFDAGNRVDSTFAARELKGRERARTTTDSNGEFRFELEQGARLSLLLEPEGAPHRAFGAYDVPGGLPLLDLQLELEDAGSLEGRVLVPPGETAAGRRVVVCPGWNTTFQALADEDGHYRIEGLPPGEYQVLPGVGPGDLIGGCRCALRFRRLRSRNELVADCVVRAGETTNYDLDLTDEARLEARLLVGDAPLSGATVRVDGTDRATCPEGEFGTALVDAEGRFGFRIGAGSYKILSRLEDENPTRYRGLSAVVDLVSGENRFEWAPGAGSVILRHRSEPAETFSIQLRRSAEDGVSYSFFAFFDRRWAGLLRSDFEIPALPVGSYDVLLPAHGPRQKRIPLEVREDEASILEIP